MTTGWIWIQQEIHAEIIFLTKFQAKKMYYMSQLAGFHVLSQVVELTD